MSVRIISKTDLSKSRLKFLSKKSYVEYRKRCIGVMAYYLRCMMNDFDFLEIKKLQDRLYYWRETLDWYAKQKNGKRAKRAILLAEDLSLYFAQKKISERKRNLR